VTRAGRARLRDRQPRYRGVPSGAARRYLRRSGEDADRTWRPAAISIGTRPQFYENGPLLVEVHLPGFEGDLYDASLDVAFLARLRGEEVFSDVDALVAQIGRDVQQTVELFKKFSEFTSALLE